jgi:hypothetical protein
MARDRGASASQNAGAPAGSATDLAFLDDDVRRSPDCLSMTVAEYPRAAWTGSRSILFDLGAVCPWLPASGRRPGKRAAAPWLISGRLITAMQTLVDLLGELDEPLHVYHDRVFVVRGSIVGADVRVMRDSGSPRLPWELTAESCFRS